MCMQRRLWLIAFGVAFVVVAVLIVMAEGTR